MSLTNCSFQPEVSVVVTWILKASTIVSSFRDAADDRGSDGGTQGEAQRSNNALCDWRIYAVTNRVGIWTQKTHTCLLEDICSHEQGRYPDPQKTCMFIGSFVNRPAVRIDI